MDEGAKRLADIIMDVFKLITIIIGGLWVYFRFKREDTHVAKVTFDIDGTFFLGDGEPSLAEFVMTIRNNGLVKHSFNKITLRVRGIRVGAPLNLWGDTQRVEFPERIVNVALLILSDQ